MPLAPHNFPCRFDASGNYFPVVPLALEFGNKKQEFFALIDSGATTSIFRSEVAESLGIKIERSKEIYIGGVGGRIKGYLHRIKIEIAGKSFICPMIFSYEYAVSFNLIGRDVFFKKFKIIFDEKNKKVVLR